MNEQVTAFALNQATAALAGSAPGLSLAEQIEGAKRSAVSFSKMRLPVAILAAVGTYWALSAQRRR